MVSGREHNPRVLLAVLLVLVVLALAPTRFTRWVGWFRGPVQAVLTPAAAPLSRISLLLRPGRGPATPTPEVEMLLRERDDIELRYRRAIARVEELEQLVRDLQSGVPPIAQARARRLAASRTARLVRSGAIEFRGGGAQGVTVGSVAVARRGNQLVGMVSGVGPMVSTVHPIIDPEVQPPRIRGVIAPDPGDPAGPRRGKEILLAPGPGGTLVADETPVQAAEADLVVEGRTVRLQDASWPEFAQQLTLGVIRRVEETDTPQFRRIVVEPIVDIERVRSVILLIPADDEDAS